MSQFDAVNVITYCFTFFVCAFVTRHALQARRHPDPEVQRRIIILRWTLAVVAVATILGFAADGSFTLASGSSPGRARVTMPEVLWSKSPINYIFTVVSAIVLTLTILLAGLSAFIEAFIKSGRPRRRRRYPY